MQYPTRPDPLSTDRACDMCRIGGPGPLPMVVVLLPFLCTSAAAFVLLPATMFPAPTPRAGVAPDGGGNPGAGAPIVALPGAPFLIWSAVLKHRGWEVQREGAMPGPHRQAVEQLAPKKSVSRIGRMPTVYAGAAVERRLPPGETPEGDALRRHKADPMDPERVGHVDEWRSQSLMQAMSMKPRRLSAVLA